MRDVITNGGNTLASQQIQDTHGRTSLFRLPPELRLIIWKFLIPGRKVLKARSSGASFDSHRTDDRRFVFGFDTKVSQPILSQICAESRQCLLDHGNGQFIFGREGEEGLWWGPEDVLLFAQDWSLRWGTPSLEGLKGLNHVKHIALDATQAQYIYYEYVLPEDDKNSDDDGDDDGDQMDLDEDDDGDAELMNHESRALHPESITIGYMSNIDRPHFLEYFKVLNKLTLVLEPMNLSITDTSTSPTLYRSAPVPWSHSRSLANWVTFDRDGTNVADAASKVSKLKQFWALARSLNHWSHFEFDDTFNEHRVLYDFCVDRSRTGLAQEHTRVTCFDMIDGVDWAL